MQRRDQFSRVLAKQFIVWTKPLRKIFMQLKQQSPSFL